MRVWRLVRLAHHRVPSDAFTGMSAALAGGRWNREGTRAVYASSSRSLAVLEVLVHIDRRQAPTDYAFASADVPDDEIEPVARLPRDWQAPGNVQARELGEAFLRTGRVLALSVPSVVIRAESNYVINPLHERRSKLRIGRRFEPFFFDARLFS